MSFLITLGALALLILVAYRGFSVILFAPVAALLAVLLTDPAAVLPVLHRPVHGQDGRVREALLPGVPAGRDLRQSDRAVRLLEGDRRARHPPSRSRNAR